KAGRLIGIIEILAVPVFLELTAIKPKGIEVFRLIKLQRFFLRQRVFLRRKLSAEASCEQKEQQQNSHDSVWFPPRLSMVSKAPVWFFFSFKLKYINMAQITTIPYRI